MAKRKTHKRHTPRNELQGINSFLYPAMGAMVGVAALGAVGNMMGNWIKK